MSAARWQELAAILAKSPDQVARMLDTHRPDDKGCCPGCRVSGLALPWPCSIYNLARLATAIITKDRLRGHPRS